ncbi:hypothetical protein NQ317_008935 [Molorchus minor]|uniref:Uncharacterized protein n=1 Tax=Molorchus minor TaxID=1323400 RepID=A0ABQ9K0E8_9CUCU|nr:hypothetical protein NQ317_008935 [Molorchus minor]
MYRNMILRPPIFKVHEPPLPRISKSETVKWSIDGKANKAPLSMENREYGITGILNTENNALGRPSKRRLNQGTESCIPDVSYNDESFKTACENLSFSQNVFETQDVFPNITDSFLEKLGLHESSPKQILSKEETERIFTTFAIQIALDSKDIKERLQKQKDQCTEQYEQFLSVIVSPPFSSSSEDLKYFLKDLTQASGQLGILMCENRMMRCWNLATNYMALLKQETVKLELGQTAESQIQCNTETKVSPYLRKRLKNLNVDESNDKNDRVVKHDVEQDDFR